MISAGAIFIKTRAGMEEVRSRKLKLPPKLRTVLILIDGTKPMLVLREEAGVLGAPPDFIETLMQQGLVEQVGAAATPAADERRTVVRGPKEPDLAKLDHAARFRMGMQFMNDTVVNALGIKAFFFTLKVEKCASVDDLRALARPYREAIAKASGEAEAELLSRRLREILG